MDATRALRSGDSAEKISVLKALRSIDGQDLLEGVVLALDDGDIRVRGEAFGLLMLAGEDVSDFLVSSMGSPSKNIRGFAALVLANRDCRRAIPDIAKLAGDDSAMVRSCAVGALGHLGARHEAGILVRALSDPNLEVRNGALHAVIGMDISVPEGTMEAVLKAGDEETAGMISRLKE